MPVLKYKKTVITVFSVVQRDLPDPPFCVATPAAVVSEGEEKDRNARWNTFPPLPHTLIICIIPSQQ